MPSEVCTYWRVAEIKLKIKLKAAQSPRPIKKHYTMIYCTNKPELRFQRLLSNSTPTYSKSVHSIENQEKKRYLYTDVRTSLALSACARASHLRSLISSLVVAFVDQSRPMRFK